MFNVCVLLFIVYFNLNSIDILSHFLIIDINIPKINCNVMTSDICI